MQSFPHFLLCLLAGIISFSALAQDISAEPTGKKKKKKKESVTQTDNRLKQQIDKAYFDAEKAKMMEEWGAALKGYQEVIRLDPKQASAWYQCARLYSGIQRYAEAAESALQAHELDPKNKWYLELLAKAQMQTGKSKEAIKAFEKLIDLAPGNPEYFLEFAFLLTENQEEEKAIEIYNRFERLFGIDEQVILEKFKLYLGKGKMDLAIAEIRKLVNEYPEDTRFMVMLAEVLLNADKKDEALEVYRRILQLEPDNAAALVAVLSIEQKGEPIAIEQLKTLFENPKVDLNRKVNLLYPYLSGWQPGSPSATDGLTLAEILSRVHPQEAAAWAMLGDCYYLSDREEEALTAYRRSLEIRKDIYAVWQQMFTILSGKQRWTELLALCREAEEFFPNQVVLYLYSGIAAQQLKDYSSALRSYQRGEKMAFEDAKLRAQFFSSMGDVYHSQQQHPASDSCYDQALKLYPDNANTLNNYSYYLSLRKQNLERAREMAAYANQLEPGNASYEDTYAWVLFCQGKYAEAKSWQEKAIKNSLVPSGTILEHYGDILFHLGEKDEALNYWNKAKDAGADNPVLLDKKITEKTFLE